jgi:hypothetical protein
MIANAKSATAAPDPDAIAQRIATLTARRRELETTRAEATRDLAMARERRGALLAAGSGGDALNALTARIAALVEDDDGYTRAVAVVDAQLATAEKQLQHADVVATSAALELLERRRAAMLEQLDARVRALVSEQLTTVVAELDAVEGELSAAWNAKQQARRRTGLELDGPSNNPADREWRSYPDLHAAVTLLAQYAAGESPKRKELEFHQAMGRATAPMFPKRS